MNEQAIFEAALAISDPEQRQAYLARACHDQPALREKVDGLLQSSAVAGSVQEGLVSKGGGLMSDQNLDRTIDLAQPGEAEEDDHDDDDVQLALGVLESSSKPGSIGRLMHYEILQVLGHGAFGVVLKAFDEKLHRVVAIKMMNPRLAATSPPRKRFLREARSVAAIRHENIVQVYSVEEQPLPFLVMEYIDGPTLQQKLNENGPLEVSEILNLGRQIAAGLAAAHAMQLVHRDIKPGNILLEEGADQKVKITDFGLARTVDDASMTQTGTVSGTPMYMAPEQALGQSLDHRADLFSFGSVLYQVACGRPPFRAPTTIALLRRVADDMPRPLKEILPELPEWLIAIIARLHAKNPAERFQSAREVADLFGKCQAELQLTGKVTCVALPERSVTAAAEAGSSPQAPAVPLPQRHRGSLLRVAIALVAVALSLFGLLAYGPLLRYASRWSSTPSTAESVEQGESIIANEPVSLQPAAGWYDWLAEAPPPAIAPFNRAQASLHQEKWAAYLKVPVEYTNSIGMKFRLIPPGEFLMGGTQEEIEAALNEISADDQHWQDCIKSEGPQHQVILTQPIYLGVNEVTQGEYQKVMGTNPANFAETGTGSEAVAGMETTNHPVEMVSWSDAAEFCSRLSTLEKLKPFYFQSEDLLTPLEGTGYRLPSEAEWEFACRAGSKSPYWIGDGQEDLQRAGWNAENSGGRTHAAGELKANPFGLCDVHGNVWEWVQDGWEPDKYSNLTQLPAVNPGFPYSAGSHHIMRGGNWYDRATLCRSSVRNRNAGYPTYADDNIGFRVLLYVKRPAAK